MDLKEKLTKQGMKWMQDPRVARLVQDERVMKAFMQLLQLRGKIQQSFDERVDRLARSLNLATKREIRELKRTMRKMEQELERQRGQQGGKGRG